MSDCSNSSMQPYDVARLRIEFQDGEVPWMYPLSLNGRTISGVYVDNERYEKPRKTVVANVTVQFDDEKMAELREEVHELIGGRIAELEQLVQDALYCLDEPTSSHREIHERARKLGIEADYGE